MRTGGHAHQRKTHNASWLFLMRSGTLNANTSVVETLDTSMVTGCGSQLCFVPACSESVKLSRWWSVVACWWIDGQPAQHSQLEPHRLPCYPAGTAVRTQRVTPSPPPYHRQGWGVKGLAPPFTAPLAVRLPRGEGWGLIRIRGLPA